MAKICCVYLAGHYVNISSTQSDSKDVLRRYTQHNPDYYLFVGEIKQFPEREINSLREKQLVVHFATNIVNMNYRPDDNPRLAYLLLRNNDTLKQLIGE